MTLKYYDTVKRILRSKNGVKNFIVIKRYKCVQCKYIRRILPEDLIRNKHYDVEIIRGVVEGLITSDTLGFEDYPCEVTMKRWKASQDLQRLL